MTPENPIVGGTALRIPAMTSPNFDLADPSASPSPSWGILQSGLAYFFGLVLSGGTITGPDYIINSSGIFIYSGAPALGNLIFSIAATAGTDGFGNVYVGGFANYSTDLSPQVTTQILDSNLVFAALSAFPSGIGAIVEGNSGTMFISSGSQNAGTDLQAEMLLQSAATAGGGQALITVTNANLDMNGGSLTDVNAIGTDSLTSSGTVAGIQVPQTAVLTSPKTISSSGSFTNLGLQVALEAGATYAVEIRLFGAPSGTIGGTHTVGVNYSAAGTSAQWNGVCFQATSTSTITQATGTSSSAPSTGNVSVVTSSTHVAFDCWTEITGYFIPGASGNLNVVCEVSVGADTVTWNAGSLLRVTRVA